MYFNFVKYKVEYSDLLASAFSCSKDATIVDVERSGEKFCDGCGQKIPPGAKLATRTEDGRDLCLACQIREAQIVKGLRH